MLSSITSLITTPAVIHSIAIGVELYIGYRIYDSIKTYMTLYYKTMSPELTNLTAKIVTDISRNIEEAIKNKNIDSSSVVITGQFNTSVESNDLNIKIRGPFEINMALIGMTSIENTNKLE
jgi:hypothetical protein